MGKREEFSRGYSAGMMAALDIVQNGGADALEKEIRFRGILKVKVPLKQSEIEEGLATVKYTTIRTIGIIACMALRNEYGFSLKRLRRFLDRFKLDALSLAEDEIVTWDDYIDTIQEETKLDLRKEWDERFPEGI